MRLLMEVVIPVEKGNAAVTGGSLNKVFDDFIDEVQPEGAYFCLRSGKRAALFIFEELNQGKLMVYNERFFAALNAEISIQPLLSHAEVSNQLER